MFKRYCEMPTSDQSEPTKAPLVQQQGKPQGELQGSSIVTSTSMTSSARDPVSLQQVEQ